MVRYGEADLHGGVVVGVALSGQQELTARQQKQQQ